MHAEVFSTAIKELVNNLCCAGFSLGHEIAGSKYFPKLLIDKGLPVQKASNPTPVRRGLPLYPRLDGFVYLKNGQLSLTYCYVKENVLYSGSLQDNVKAFSVTLLSKDDNKIKGFPLGFFFGAKCLRLTW